MKLELKHLATYFPYKVKYRTLLGFIEEMKFLSIDSAEFYKIHKLILRPLSDLKKINTIDSKTIQIQLLELDNDVSIISYQLHEWLLENHFDVFGLIESDLAIDVNTL